LKITIGIATTRRALRKKTSCHKPFMNIIKCATLPKSTAPVKIFDVVKGNSILN
jgi:hypothetical protein